jgi:5-methylcytosine-specific restriction protein A
VTWAGDPRTSTAEWKATRLRILRRDGGRCHVCHLAGATQVDHVVPKGEGGGDEDTNLAAIHDDPCHRQKSAAEGLRARRRYPRKRPVEPHPGLIG